MPQASYSFETGDEKKIARAYARDVDISPKHAFEIFNSIRGKPVSKAEAILSDAISFKRPIPFRKFNKKNPHRKGQVKEGKYPQKASKRILKLLQNASANAEFKGLSSEKLKIVHACANRGLVLPRKAPKGRWKRSNIELVNLELVVKEV
jgi:large subunit ribosomal protein L22